jgi:hypothetical protein
VKYVEKPWFVDLLAQIIHVKKFVMMEHVQNALQQQRFDADVVLWIRRWTVRNLVLGQTMPVVKNNAAKNAIASATNADKNVASC